MNILKQYSWEEIEKTNEMLCKKAGYDFNRTSDGYDKSKSFFETLQKEKNLSIGKCVHAMQVLHKMAPFIFLNGNTFTEIGKRLISPAKPNPTTRNIVGHYIAGVNDITKQDMINSLKDMPGLKTLMTERKNTKDRFFEEAVEYKKNKDESGLKEALIDYKNRHNIVGEEYINLKKITTMFYSGTLNEKNFGSIIKEPNQQINRTKTQKRTSNLAPSMAV